MAFIAAAIIGGAFGVGASIIGGNAAKKAAETSAAAAKEMQAASIAAQKENAATVKTTNQPWYDAGVTALGNITAGMSNGTFNPGTFTSSAEYDPGKLDVSSIKDPGAFSGKVDLNADPGYQFRKEQGQLALDRGAAARGTVQSGAQVKATEGFAQGLASQEYGNAFDRAYHQYGSTVDEYNRNVAAKTADYNSGVTQKNALYNQAKDVYNSEVNNTNNQFNKEVQVSNIGQAAAEGNNAATTNTANSITNSNTNTANALTSAANTSAGATASTAAGIATSVNTGLQNYMIAKYAKTGPKWDAATQKWI